LHSSSTHRIRFFVGMELLRSSRPDQEERNLPFSPVAK
jgi:hypothetical protein